MSAISKAMREKLPETIDGLEEFIRRGEKETERISKMVTAARSILIEKQRGRRI